MLFALLPPVLATPDCGPESCPIVTDLGGALEAVDPSFDAFNNPADLAPDYAYTFAELPLYGEAERVPWTDSYWPKHEGGIAHRWQTGEERDYPLLGLEELSALTPEELARLSPTEKYDLLVGNYQYTLTYRAQAESPASASSWTGYCHGWTSASIHYEEPQPVVMTNPDGLEIPFGSSDIKALLSYFAGEVVHNTRYPESAMPWATTPRGIGTLCLSNNPATPSCQDTDAGAFHVVLTNQLGLRQEAFGIDATTTAEKWNQPVHRYATEVLGTRPPSPGASPNAVEEKLTRSHVTWTVEVEPTWDPLLGTPGHKDTTETYTYTVELDADGQIIGGQWVVLFDDGSDYTLQEAIEVLQTRDENNDGTPDLSEDQIEGVIWEHFSFPDYTWVQDPMAFSDTFKEAWGPYELLSNNQGTREKLFHYMAELGTLYEASRDPKN